jgi:transketolase
MRDAAVRRLTKLAETNSRLILITGDLGFGVLTEFAKRFPRQFINAGVAEQNMLGIAVGLALEGRVSIVYSIGNFPTLRCLEQIRNDACYHDANVKIMAVGGGFSYGALGMSHYATEDIAILRSIPSLTVLSPGDRHEAEQATEAIVARPGTAYLRLDKSYANSDAAGNPGFEFGKFRRLREGADISILATGGILKCALEAAGLLEKHRIACRVYSVHTIKPFDHEELKKAAAETGGLITIEEHMLDGGLGSVVAEACMDRGLRPRTFLRIGLPGEFPQVVGTQDYLRALYKLDPSSIATTVLDLLRRQKLRASIGS